MRLPSREERLRWRRYWIRDVLVGARLVAGHHALRLLPTDAVSALGGQLGRTFAPRTQPAADRRVRAGLQRLRPDLASDPRSLDAAAAQVWEQVGRCYAEFSVEDRLWSEGRVATEGREHLDAAAAGGRPVIVAALHTGNWELVTVSLGSLGHSVVQIIQPPRNRFERVIAERSRARADARFGRVREGQTLELVPPSLTAGLRLRDGLRAGAVAVMFTDESVGNRTLAPFFGRPLDTEGNYGRIARLARHTGAAVVPGHVVRRRPDGADFVVRYHPAVQMVRSDDERADRERNVAALDAAADPIVREHLLQWFMLVDLPPEP